MLYPLSYGGRSDITAGQRGAVSSQPDDITGRVRKWSALRSQMLRASRVQPLGNAVKVVIVQVPVAVPRQSCRTVPEHGLHHL